MSKIIIPGWGNREGKEYWGGDRFQRMRKQDDNKMERGKMALLDTLLSLPGPVKLQADLGCGIGRRNHQYPGLEYTGFDREEIMVEEAKKRYPDLTFHLCDLQLLVEKFPQYEDHFDVATTFHVIQYNHVEQQEEIIRGIRFILRPGGYLYMKENTIYEHNNNGVYSDLDSVVSKNTCSYTRAGWVAKFAQHGFELMASDDMHGHFIFRKRN